MAYPSHSFRCKADADVLSTSVVQDAQGNSVTSASEGCGNWQEV